MKRSVIVLIVFGAALLASLLWAPWTPVPLPTPTPPQVMAPAPAGGNGTPAGPAVGSAVPSTDQAQLIKPPPGVRDLKWEELMPAGWNPRQAIDRLNLKNVGDNDPRANELLAEVRAEWDRAPVVKKLAGQKVRLPGYIVGLEGDGEGVREFLLVPYFGACIHVPAPPSNQIVHVFADRSVPDALLYEAVWITGVIELEQVDTALGSAGYRIRQATVEPYGKPANR
jgi:uncharacterized protein